MMARDLQDYKQFAQWLNNTYPGQWNLLVEAGIISPTKAWDKYDDWWSNRYYHYWITNYRPQSSPDAPDLPPLPYDKVSYETLIKTDLSPEEKFNIIATNFPDRLREWLAKDEGEGANWLATLTPITTDIGNIILLPNGQYWNNTTYTFADTEQAENAIEQARGGEEQLVIPSEWSYDTTTGIYTNPEDGSQWVIGEDGKLHPATPEDKPTSIPEGSTFNPTTGVWTLPDGTKVTIDPITGKLIPVTTEPPKVTPPSFTYDPESGIYTDSETGTEYTLDPNTGDFIPVTPEDAPSEVPTGSTYNPVTGIWTAPDGAKYTLDPNTNEYVPVTPEAPEVSVVPSGSIFQGQFPDGTPIYKTPDGSFGIVDNGVWTIIDPIIAQQGIDNFLESIKAIPKINVPADWTFDPTTGIYTDPQGNEFYPDPNQPGKLIPVTQKSGVPVGSSFDPTTGVWTDPSGNELVEDSQGNIVPVTPGTLPPNLPANATTIVPDQLYQLPDGSYVGKDGRPVDTGTAQQIIDDYKEGGVAPWEQPISPYQQAGIDLQQQQLAQSQAQWQAQRKTEEEQYLRNLRAEPVSWLEYAMAQGKPGVVQPFMQPLMWGQYQGMQPGQVIPTGQPQYEPGYQPQAPPVTAPTGGGGQPIPQDTWEPNIAEAQQMALSDPAYIAASARAQAAIGAA